MATFLLKTEPGTYSFDDLLKDGKTTWDGVTNPGALAHLRAAKKGDQAFIYHSGDEKAIVGLAEITRNAYPDPKKSGLTAKGEVKFPVVDLRPLKRAKTPVTLAAIKGDKRFKDFALVKQTRLSVMVVPGELAEALRGMAGV